MDTMRLTRLVFLAAALAGLSACGSISAPLQSASSTQFNAAGSWTSRAAAQNNLLYVSDARGTVDIFTYPDGKPAGELKGFDSPAGLCTDSSGDLYVVDTGLFEVLEYEHGGTKPINEFFVMGFYPYGCAVDPSSGDLAVADFASQQQGPGGLSVFHAGQTFPSTYQDQAFNAYFFCAYDDRGNIFVDGADYGSYHTLFAELPNGSTTFTPISLDKTIGYPGGLAWDGAYLATQDTASRVLYRFKMSGAKGKAVGSTSFKGARSTLVHQFAIAGKSIVMPYGTTGRVLRKLGFWPYPNGGSASKSIAVAHATELFGVALSAAKK